MSETVLGLLDCDTNHLGDKLKCRTISSGLASWAGVPRDGFWETGDCTEIPHHRKHPAWSWGAWGHGTKDLQLKTYWVEGTEANLCVCWLPPISGQQITWHLRGWRGIESREPHNTPCQTSVLTVRIRHMFSGNALSQSDFDKSQAESWRLVWYVF